MGDISLRERLGYKKVEENPPKYRFEKETRYGIFSITIDTYHKDVSANMIPSLLIVYERHVEGYANAFKEMMRDAKEIAQSIGYKLLNEV